jgi:hypothetical protein
MVSCGCRRHRPAHLDPPAEAASYRSETVSVGDVFREARSQLGEAPQAGTHLLFLLRCAMLFLLALLFAEPFINRTPEALNTKRLVVVAVDQSFSMRAADRLTKAKDERWD